MSSTEEVSNIPVQKVPEDTLAMRVGVARRERRLSQRAAAEQCGLTFGEWQGIEDGRKVTELDRKVAQIADGLDYDRDWLMWGGPMRKNIAMLMEAFRGLVPAA